MALKEALEKLKSVAPDLLADVEAGIKDFEQAASDTGARLADSVKAAQLYKGKHASILAALGLTDDDDAPAGAQKIKADLDAFNKGGKQPDEIGALTRQVETVTKQLADMTKAAQTEKDKRIAAIKHNEALAALTKGNAASPEQIAKILLADIKVKDDGETLYFEQGGKETSIADGAAAWLKDNPWAVKDTSKAGGGAPAGGSGGAGDPFEQGFNSK